jgi:hypothetical protein
VGEARFQTPSGRFEKQYAEPFDDGWETDDEKPETLKTETIVERPKTIITYNTSPDISFDRTINPYKGCEHGCIYCFARPNHAYRGLSPGLDFETKIFVKPSAASLLEKELAKKSYKPGRIMLAGDTDIYQPLEKELHITRSILEVLARIRSSCRSDHQVRADPARSRLHRADGGERPGLGRDLFHHARQQARAHDGAALRSAASARRDDARTQRRWHSRHGDDRADHPRPQRARTRTAAGSSGRCRRHSAPAMCCCACHSRSQACSPSGSRRIIPIAPSA